MTTSLVNFVEIVRVGNVWDSQLLPLGPKQLLALNHRFDLVHVLDGFCGHGDDSVIQLLVHHFPEM